MLRGKHILLGVTGSIAAYKAAFLVRLLVKAGAEVRVALTPDAGAFVSPLTFATLSKNEALVDFTKGSGSDWNNHVEHALWADVILIAPATANTLAKMAHGLCDNLLLAIYQSAKSPVCIAPAMDLDMYKHPATQENLKRLSGFLNHHLISVGDGELASGLEGEGRMAEPEAIVQFLEDKIFTPDQVLCGKKVVLTAGPTQEPLDPVRYLTNHSTGKMGIALAEAFADAGANVTLILGPTNNRTSDPSVEVIPVTTTDDMYEASKKAFPNADIFIGAGAVSDYTPKQKHDQKMKKTGDDLNLELTRTPDILAELGKMKKKGQWLVGFALETNDAEANARKKLASKNLDLIVLNSLEDEGAGFAHDTNKITLLDKNNNSVSFELKAKSAVAQDILDYLKQLMDA